MKIHIRTKQIEVDENLRARIARRLEFSLGRFSSRILRATMRLTDVNGLRGGEDKVCRIEVRLRPSGTVFVEDRDSDLVAIVDRAADRIGRTVARELERNRDLTRAARSGHVASLQPDRAENESHGAEVWSNS